MNNLIGDCYTVAIVQHLSKQELQVSVSKTSVSGVRIRTRLSIVSVRRTVGPDKSET